MCAMVMVIVLRLSFRGRCYVFSLGAFGNHVHDGRTGHDRRTWKSSETSVMNDHGSMDVEI